MRFDAVIHFDAETPLIPGLSSTPKTAGFHALKNAGWEGQQPMAPVATATTLQKQRHTYRRHFEAKKR